jgi:rhodanese-related sulfurtransferase
MSLNIPLGQLVGRLDELPDGRPLVVHCQTGYRSSTAASPLMLEGRQRIADLVGGISVWQASPSFVRNHGPIPEVDPAA